MSERKFHLGLVTGGDGKSLPTEGFITYGPSSHPDDEEGEIKIEGADAAKIAALICELWNTR